MGQPESERYQQDSNSFDYPPVYSEVVKYDISTLPSDKAGPSSPAYMSPIVAPPSVSSGTKGSSTQIVLYARNVVYL